MIDWLLFTKQSGLLAAFLLKIITMVDEFHRRQDKSQDPRDDLARILRCEGQWEVQTDVSLCTDTCLSPHSLAVTKHLRSGKL